MSLLLIDSSLLYTTYLVENKEDKPLNKPFRTPNGPGKFAVYVKNDK